MNLREFEKWAVAQKQVGNPTKEGSYKGECVSLVQQYLDKVHNIPFKARGNAKDWANVSIEGFDRIGSDNKLKAGDILVYNRGKFGHVAIVDADLKSLEQNKGGNRKVTVGAIDKTYIKIQRPKKVDLGVQETKSIVDLAQEVIAGKYGVGQERKDKLGSLYNEVQAKVNEILLGKKVENKKNNEEIAKEVLKGEWGNGEERKNRLEKAGYSYIEVQTIVNKLLK